MSANFIQLLPKPDEARLIRVALNYLMMNTDLSTEDQDRAWKIIADISVRLTDERR